MLPFNRRAFLGRTAQGVGSAALASLLFQQARAAEKGPPSLGFVNPLHHVPKAKRVIWLYMAGGMTHLETFDLKPEAPAEVRAAAKHQLRADIWTGGSVAEAAERAGLI